jgi:ribonuclease HII
MAYIIGTDEAGYGPNLGPLVISATMWRLPERLLDDNLYDLLAHAVAGSATAAAKNGRVAIADSKALYQSGGSLAPLELGVLPALGVRGKLPATWRGLFDLLDANSAAARSQVPWYRDFELAVPVAAGRDEVNAATQRLRQTLSDAGVSLCEIRSRVLFASQFNDQVKRYDNKATVLSRATLGLVADLVDGVQSGPIQVLCDKHGGRNKYAGLLQELAGTGLVQVVVESRAESRYRFGPAARRVDIRFIAKGERFLPSALASMASKYLRELAMSALNRYWCDRIDGLKPTAGYPTDARRWLASVKAVKEELQIDDHLLWRCR